MEKLTQVFSAQVTIFGHVITFNPVMLAMTWVVIALILFLAYFGTRSLSILPGKLQSIFELIYEFLEDITISTLGTKDGKKFLPFVVAIFIFILTSNWISLIPNILAFFGSIVGLIYLALGSPAVSISIEGWSNIQLVADPSAWFSFLLNVPEFTEPTRVVSTPLALAILVFFAVQGYGIQNKGFFGYLRGFVDDPFPMKGFWIVLFPINPFFYLNIIGTVANVVSHAFRLFGNIFGGGMIIIIVSSLLHHLLIPVGLNAFFTIFAGVVQAFVFTMLTVTYIQQQQ